MIERVRYVVLDEGVTKESLCPAGPAAVSPNLLSSAIGGANSLFKPRERSHTSSKELEAEELNQEDSIVINQLFKDGHDSHKISEITQMPSHTVHSVLYKESPSL